jgi:Tol biopolymer transport system component
VTHINAWTWVAGQRRARAVGEYLWEYDGGSGISALAADGAILVYGTFVYRNLPLGCDEGPIRCHLFLVGGTVQRVGRRSYAKLFEVPPAALAVNAGRIAVLPMESEGCACNRDPSWAPDGQRIAFSSRRLGPDTDISSVRASGGKPIDVTTNFRDDREPDWSPDGEKIVFVASDAIWTVRRDGKDERLLLADCQYCSSPTWSPDGSKIAFYKSSDDGVDVFVVQADGSGRVRLAEGSDPAWSPDGRSIAFKRYRSGSGIWLMDADGSNQRPLAQGSDPAWSTTGKIAFVGSDGHDAELYVISPDGTGQRQITDNLDNDYSPDWSPDGERLAFIRDRRTKLQEELYVMNADGSGTRRLTTTRSAIARFPIEVRTARNGAVISRFMPTGRASEIALSREFVAVLVQEGHRRAKVEFFNPASGARLGAVGVPRTARALSISGKTIVFAAGRKIWMLDAASRKASVLALARTTPISLSIEGRSVAWAENGRKRGLVRALWLRAPR